MVQSSRPLFLQESNGWLQRIMRNLTIPKMTWKIAWMKILIPVKKVDQKVDSRLCCCLLLFQYISNSAPMVFLFLFVSWYNVVASRLIRLSQSTRSGSAFRLIRPTQSSHQSIPTQHQNFINHRIHQNYQQQEQNFWFLLHAINFSAWRSNRLCSTNPRQLFIW